MSQNFNTIRAKSTIQYELRKKKFYQGFILIENFERFYLKTIFLKSVETISQKLMHRSV